MVKSIYVGALLNPSPSSGDSPAPPRGGEFKYGDSVVKYALTKAREEGLLWCVEVGGRKGSGFFMVNPLLYKE
jgi:hypothetical protein